MGQVQDGVAQHHHRFLMLKSKSTRERVVVGFYEATFPGPLPELCLCGPKLLTVAANHQRRFLFLFLLRAQFNPRFIGKHFDLRISSFASTIRSRAVPPKGKPLMRGGI
jgi:hypothetical protein